MEQCEQLSALRKNHRDYNPWNSACVKDDKAIGRVHLFEIWPHDSFDNLSIPKFYHLAVNEDVGGLELPKRHKTDEKEYDSQTEKE